MENGSSLIKFKSNEEEYEKFYSERGFVVINAICTCDKDIYGKPQLIIQDYEIITKRDYDF